MDTKTQTQLVHLACVLTIALCLTLAFTVLKPYPEPAAMLFALSVFLYGKLGFKPASPVLAGILAKLDPIQLQALSQRPPAFEPKTVSDVINRALSTGEVAVGHNVIDDVGLRADPVEPPPKDSKP